MEVRCTWACLGLAQNQRSQLVLPVIYRKDARMIHEYQCNAWGAKSGKMHNLPILTPSSHLLLYP
jgi:hypothetical protein